MKLGVSKGVHTFVLLRGECASHLRDGKNSGLGFASAMAGDENEAAHHLSALNCLNDVKYPLFFFFF